MRGSKADLPAPGQMGTNTEANDSGPRLSTSDARLGPALFEPRGGGALSASGAARFGRMACLVYTATASPFCTLPALPPGAVCPRKQRSPDASLTVCCGKGVLSPRVQEL